MEKQVDFIETIQDAFLIYGSSVAQERAIPDVRDMLKIGLRQGVYAQFSNKLTHKDKFQKAQKSVAAAMAQSYVHGDVAMYDTFIRAARPWSYRYPIEDVQGSYGNPTSPDSHAAARYVEMKAGELANFFFDGLKKNAIGTQWYNNYDDTEQIPSVFPSIGFWNIVNGCSGIAVAMATSVPQFNLREVNNALIKIIQNPDVNFDEIYCAPDFACGGTIMNSAAVKESLKNGNGESIRLQAKLVYFPDQNMIQATELPYGVYTNTIIDQLAALTTDNPDYGIEKVVDHTKKVADIHIYLTKGANPKKMIEKLYKDTSLENWFSINMILLDNGRFPKIFGWRKACDAYIAHIRECERNIIQFDMDKALARKNVVDGLIKAYSIIDEVVALIRGSSNPTEAAQKLISVHGFNEEQAKAILAMKLSSLTKLDIVKLNEEAAELTQKIEWYHYLLNNPTALDNELIKILKEVAEKFGDERRTIIKNVSEPTEEVKVEEKEVNIFLFDNNNIRVLEKDDLKETKRGRKGTSIKPPKGSNLIKTLYSTNLSFIAAFSNLGRMYSLNLNELNCNEDYSLYQLLPLQNKEKIILLIDSTSLSAYKNLITISKNGYIKKTFVKEYLGRSKKGTVAAKLDENDTLISAYLSSSDNDKIFIAGENGYYNYYEVSKISNTGKVSRGVKAINDEHIIDTTFIREGIEYRGILTITDNGNGKITPIDDFPQTNKNVKGVKIMECKDGNIAAVSAITTEQEHVLVSSNNKAALLDINSIPVQNRLTTGVKIINASSTKIEIM